MISGMANRHLQKKNKNKGAALVMVIVAIAFIGMLVAMILYMSYANYIMKGTDKSAKDNFYSAEYALDVINAGIQTDISTEMSKAYVYVMQNSQDWSDDKMTSEFQKKFKANMLTKIEQSSTDNTIWKADYLTQKWDGNTVFEKSTTPGALPSTTSGAACLQKTINAAGELDITHDDYFDIRGVKITYTDKKGYVSVINTDIRVTVPSIDFAQSATKLSVENYSLIANDELLNISNVADYKTETGNDISSSFSGSLGSSSVAVTGNVFGGYDGIWMDDQKKLLFRNDLNDKAQADADGVPYTRSYLLAADSILVDNCKDSRKGLEVEDHYETFVSNINVNTANLVLTGSSYVADDLEIGGKSSNVTLKGVYKGYGNNNTGASGSSSILINGAGTTLDFSGLKTLSLAGHAYVGATKYDADATRQVYATVSGNAANATVDPNASDKIESQYNDGKADTYDKNNANTENLTIYPQNESDVLMGQSVAVKADQLLYLIPDDCVGYDNDTNTYRYCKNPLTYDEYMTLLTTPSEKEHELNADNTYKVDAEGNYVMKKRYDVVNLTNLWSSLGGTTYTDSKKYKAVFRRVSGTVLVYLYLDFGTNESMANEFYKSCYETKPDTISNYVKSYVRDIKFSPELIANGDDSLNLAGNAFYLNRNDVVFQKDTTDSANKLNRLYEEADSLADQYTAAMHSLQTNYSLMQGDQETTEIFDYLVPDRSVLGQLKGKELTDGVVKAIVSNEDVIYNASVTDYDKVHVIITSKDVYLDNNYKGLVIAGGRVFIGSNCAEVVYSPELVVQSLKAFYDDGSGNKRYAYEALGVNGLITYGVATGGSTDKIEIRDLITYQNWKKE